MLLEVKDLKKYFPGKGKKPPVRAVDGVTFNIEKGETFGLVGESGCGKSTVARTIIKLYELTDGTVIFDGQDVTHLDKKARKEFSNNIQMVFQDPYASLNPRMTVEEAIMDALNIHNVGTKEERVKRVEKLLEVVGLDKRYAKRYPHEFSGGQRQRIGIARALALDPKFVILDEAVSALDVSIQAQVLNLLMDLQEKLGLTYLFISHDLGVVEYMCDRIGVMYLGRLVEIGTREDIFEKTAHPYSKALLSAIPDLDPESQREQIILKGDLPSLDKIGQGCPFHTRCESVMDICRTSMPQYRQLGEKHCVACHLYDDVHEG